MTESKTIELFGVSLTNTNGVVAAEGDRFHLPSGTQIELATLWQFVYAQSASDAYVIAVANPELLDPDIDPLLVQLSDFMPLGVANLSGPDWQAETARLWNQAREALQLCRRSESAAVLRRFFWKAPDQSKAKPAGDI
jgi:hypothetical protein